MAIVETTRPITGGVDTHLDVHVAAALDANGGVLGVESFPTTTAGLVDLAQWLSSFGVVELVGVEGTGAYGAGLARHLRSLDVAVIEVDRPNRQLRRSKGKSDIVDAVEAGRAVLSGRASGIAKSADGNTEALRVTLIAKRSAREARITCLNQIRYLGFCGPAELREHFAGVPKGTLAARAAALRPRRDADVVTYATKLAMRTLGRRVLAAKDDIVAESRRWTAHPRTHSTGCGSPWVSRSMPAPVLNGRDGSELWAAHRLTEGREGEVVTEGGDAADPYVAKNRLVAATAERSRWGRVGTWFVPHVEEHDRVVRIHRRVAENS